MEHWKRVYFMDWVITRLNELLPQKNERKSPVVLYTLHVTASRYVFFDLQSFDVFRNCNNYTFQPFAWHFGFQSRWKSS